MLTIPQENWLLLDFIPPDKNNYKQTAYVCCPRRNVSITRSGYTKAYLATLREHKQRRKYFERIVHRRITRVRKINRTMDIDLR